MSSVVRPAHAPRAVLAVLVLVLAAAPALAQPAETPSTPRPAALAPAPASGAWAAVAQTPPPRWGADPGESQLFHVTLVAASRQGGGGGQGALPKGVAQALDDIKDFLPYQGYRVVDSALVRGSGEAHATLKGPDGTAFEAILLFRAAEEGGDAKSFLVEHFELRRPLLAELPARDPEGARAGRPALAPMAPQPALRASFRIDEGETVVVGSSRLDGGEDALIVLLTAVP
ncbi:MAG TPA: hypothetical protein VF150_02780 [Thermoanaerobaculia bacterium]